MSDPNALLRIYTDEAAFFGDQRVYRVIVERARAAGLAGATVLQALYGFRGRRHLHARHVLEDDQSVVVEIVDGEPRVRAFAATLADLPDIGLITLEKVEVLQAPAADPEPAP
jgi:uncharacterized protein